MAIHSVCNRIMADSIKMLLALISANNDMNERDGTNASLLDEGRSLKVSEFIKEKAE